MLPESNSPYINCRGLGRMVLYVSARTTGDNATSVGRQTLVDSVLAECTYRREPVPAESAIATSFNELVEQEFLKPDSCEAEYSITPLGSALIDAAHGRIMITAGPINFKLCDAVALLHNLLKEVAITKNFQFDPRASVRGGVLSRVLKRWAGEYGLQGEQYSRALAITAQCGCVDLVSSAVPAFVDFMLQWSDGKANQCVSAQLIERMSIEQSILIPDMAIFREWLLRAIATTEVPATDRAQQYPTMESRKTALAWVQDQKWPQVGMLFPDLEDLLQKLFGIESGNRFEPYPKGVHECILRYIKEIPDERRKFAIETLCTARIPSEGATIEAVGVLFDQKRIYVSGIRCVREFESHLGVGVILRSTAPLPSPTTTPKVPTDLCSTRTAVKEFEVSRATLFRAMDDGLITSYRPVASKSNASHRFSKAQLAIHFGRRGR